MVDVISKAGLQITEAELDILQYGGNALTIDLDPEGGGSKPSQS